MSIPNANSNVENVQALAIGCELCGGPHAYGECPSTNREDANFVLANQQRSFQPSNQWKQPQHPGFSWSNQGASLNPPNARPQNPPGFQARQNFQNFQSNPRSNIDNVMEGILQQAIKNKEYEAKISELTSKIDQVMAHNRILENQIAQKAISSNANVQGTLPSQPDCSQKESCQAISLRSGKEVEIPMPKQSQTISKPKNVEATPSREEGKQDEVNISTLPFPQRLIRNKLDKQFGKFLDYMKEITINIPFVEAIRDMPLWDKFLKEILQHKRRFDNESVVALLEAPSFLSKIPLKCKDPGSFTVPCAIGNASYEKALCDLGASVSLMPYDIFKKLEIGDLKPTRVVLSMADKSLKYPLGVVEDVPTRVGKFVFPADFIVVDMEVNSMF